MKIFKIGFGNQCLLALVLGFIIGNSANSAFVNFVEPLGIIFLKLLQLIIVPLTFSTIVASFAKHSNMRFIQKIGISTLLWFLFTAVIASIIGVLIGSIIAPGVGIGVDANQINNYQERVVPTISNTFLSMIPSNIIGDISQGRIIPVIIFAIIFGVTLAYLQDKVQIVKNFFSECSIVMFSITRFIIKLSPIGIFALTMQVGFTYGFAMIIPLIKFIIAIYCACFLQIIVYLILIFIIAKKNPITFLRNFYPAMITAFSTSSSLGTLPVTLESLVDKVGVHENIAGFVAPLAATMKMDGCGAIYPAIVCILTANMLHIDLTIYHYIIIIMVATIASIGTAGVPGTASVTATLVLSSIGFPLSGLAIVIGIDKIVDMMRTLTNVTGGGACAVLVDSYYENKPEEINEYK